jgi:hypothetical protein
MGFRQKEMSKVKEIELTQGYVAFVDDADFERLRQHKWYAVVKTSRPCKKVYAVRNERVDPIGGIGRQRRIWMHRDILNAAPDIEVDHRDGNSLDNRRHNLRSATKTQNRQNRKAQTGSSSPFVGVAKVGNRYRATIDGGAKRQHVGTYRNELEAAAARDRAAIKLYGEFAHLNLPEHGP